MNEKLKDALKWVSEESRMYRKMISKITMIFVIVCLGNMAFSSCVAFDQNASKKQTLPSIHNTARVEQLLPPPAKTPGGESVPQLETAHLEKKEQLSATSEEHHHNPPVNTTVSPKRDDGLAKSYGSVDGSHPTASSESPRTSEGVKENAIPDPVKMRLREVHNAHEEETERDIMEEALVLLEESHKYWVKGDMEDALNMLDQAYALLIDTNGNPDITRQKDDLRLMISKRILAIYNSLQSVAEGKRGEIPIIVNEDIEKEIRQFQTVERDFFLSSYQRSMIYRPTILRELRRAGLPEELSWLPLVESGFKITALSSARALGLWQFIPSTGYKYGLNRDDWVDERMDVEKSTRAAIDYLKDLHAIFGDWLTVLAGYNCGEGRVMRTIAAQHINYLDRFWDLYQQLPYETARYVPRFLATLLIVRDPQKYEMDLRSDVPMKDILSYETAETDRCMRLQDIAQKADISEEVLSILNAELRHRMTPDRPYQLKVPIAKAEPLLQIIAEIPQGNRPRGSSWTARGIVIKHKVKSGETLFSIAEKYKTSIESIKSANRLSANRLAAGQRLNIPVRSAKKSESAVRDVRSSSDARHLVQKGDTLSSLAQRYRISVQEIKKINHLENDSLRIGQTLRFTRGDHAEKNAGQDRTKEMPDALGKINSENRPSSGSPEDSTVLKKYTVKKGDSLYRIAKENNMSIETLLTLNRMEQKDNIHPGQVIFIR